MKTFKHKETGETATYKDGVLTQGCCSVEVGREPSSEYWEEVVEKDYEILQMKNPSGNFYSLFKGETLGKFEKNNHTIWSVKRLSDGEVFFIDDFVHFPDTHLDCKQIIKRFEINSHGNLVVKTDQTNNNGVNISKVEHYLSPVIFTTEDGVDVYEGDELYFVYNELENTTSHITVIDEPLKVKKFKWEYEGVIPSDASYYHWFSSKKSAEEYILLNKPVELSVKEITPLIGRCNNTTYVDLDCLTEKLKELVKSKL